MDIREENNKKAKFLKAYKESQHQKWLSRQQAYKKIVMRDCYGIKSNKV